MGPEFKPYHKELQEMFPELKDSSPAEEWTAPSYSDGGNLVHTVWEGPGRHTRTIFNDWCVNHPSTSLQVVKRYLHKEYRLKGIGSVKKYGGRNEQDSNSS